MPAGGRGWMIERTEGCQGSLLCSCLGRSKILGSGGLFQIVRFLITSLITKAHLWPQEPQDPSEGALGGFGEAEPGAGQQGLNQQASPGAS